MLDTQTFNLIVLPILIFLGRVVDVSMGTLRVIFLSRGHKAVASTIGFFEVSVWLLAARQALSHLDTPIYMIAYALGFSAGIFVGMSISERLSVGKVLIRIITRRDASKLIEYMKEQGRSVTWSDAEGTKGKVQIIFLVLKNKDVKSVTKVIQELHPNAFYTIEDVKKVSELDSKKSYFPTFNNIFRKGK